MKRGIILLILILVVFLPLSNAQLSSIQIKQVKINSNQLAILVESNLNKELYSLRFIITDISNNKDTIISTIPLQAYTSNWYYITYSNKLKELKNIQVEDLDQEYIDSYLFTQKEEQFIQEEVQIEQTIIQEPVVNPSKSSYIYSNNLLVAKKVNNQINYYHSDQISSTSIITDSSSSIVYKSDYLPFGTGFNIQGKEQYTYTGKELDSSGLYYYGARYYDSSTGRFTQVDPIQDYSESSYTYVENNPLVKIDPSGKQTADTAAVVDTSSFVDFRVRINWRKIRDPFVEKVYEPSGNLLRDWFAPKKDTTDFIGPPILPSIKDEPGLDTPWSWHGFSITRQKEKPDTTLTKPDTILVNKQKGQLSKKENAALGIILTTGTIIAIRQVVIEMNKASRMLRGVNLDPSSVGEAYTNPEKYLQDVNKRINKPGLEGVVNRLLLIPEIGLIEYSKQDTALPPGST